MTYYADYVNHILRFYARHIGMARFKSDADMLNYHAADKVISRLNVRERLLILEVYSNRDTLGDSVFHAAKTREISQDIIWTLIGRVSQAIAKERKLI